MVKKSKTCRERKSKVSYIEIEANFHHLVEKYSFLEFFNQSMCTYWCWLNDRWVYGTIFISNNIADNVSRVNLVLHSNNKYDVHNMSTTFEVDYKWLHKSITLAAVVPYYQSHNLIIHSKCTWNIFVQQKDATQLR